MGFHLKIVSELVVNTRMRSYGERTVVADDDAYNQTIDLFSSISKRQRMGRKID